MGLTDTGITTEQGLYMVPMVKGNLAPPKPLQRSGYPKCNISKIHTMMLLPIASLLIDWTESVLEPDPVT